MLDQACPEQAKRVERGKPGRGRERDNVFLEANAGPQAAMMFTLVENCRIEGINPEEYLIDILSRVDDHPNSRIEELTPAGWKKSKNA